MQLSQTNTKKRNGKRFYYYAHARKPKNGPALRIPAAGIEDAVWQFLAEDLCNNLELLKDAHRKSEESMASGNTEALVEWKRLQEQLRTARDERDGLLEFVKKAIRDGQEPATSLNDEIRNLDDRVRHLEVITAETKVRAKPASQLTPQAWVEVLQDIFAGDHASPKARKRIISSVVKAVIVDGEDVELILGAKLIFQDGSHGRQNWLPD